MPDGRRRSREHWTDTMEAGPPNPPAHVHRLPKFVRLALAGLAVSQALTLIGLGFSVAYDKQQQQFIEGRGHFRDRENDRTNQRINDAICDLLDQLPEGGLLERPRAKYGCGPGYPISQLPPEIAEQLRQQRTPEPEPVPVAPPDGPKDDKEN